MSTPLRPHMRKLLSEDRQKLFKKQITQLCSPSIVLGYARYIKKPLEKVMHVIFLVFMLTSTSIQFGFISRQIYLDDRSLWILLLILLLILPMSIIIILDISIWFFQKYRTSPYSQELEKTEYLVTHGFIRNIAKSSKNDALELHIEYLNLNQELISKTFHLRPIQLLHYQHIGHVLSSNPVYLPDFHASELWIGQQVELCLLPQSHLLVQIRLRNPKAKFTEIWQHQLHKKAIYWHPHTSGIPHNHLPYALANVQSIQAIKTTTGFELKFECIEQENFSISNELMNFNDVELYIQSFFKGFDQSRYTTFKQHSEVNPVQLWQTRKPVSTTIQKKEQDFQLQISIAALFSIVMIIFFVICQYSIGWGVFCLMFSLVFLLRWYFYQQNKIGFYNGQYFILNQIKQKDGQ